MCPEIEWGERGGETLTNCLSTPSQIRSEAPTVVNSTSTDNVNRLPSQRGSAPLDSVNASRDQDRSGNIPSVASTFTGLGTDNINTDVKGFLYVFGMADHIHDRDASLMKLIDDFPRGNTNCGDEKPGFFFDNHLDEFG